MKRRFVECAILLGIVVSVMFLAQTQDVIGHNEINPNTGKPHKPPGHKHNPSTNVDSKGNPVTTGGEDPRGNHYSGSCVTEDKDYQHVWGFRYGPGKYSTSTTGPDNDTQNVWSVRIDSIASTGERHARITVTPGIYLAHFEKETGLWQGSAEGTVRFSGVCYHAGLLCIKHSRAGDYWKKTGFLDLKVKNEKIEQEEEYEYGIGFESHGAKLTANSKHSYTTSYDELRARGYRFMLELKAGIWNPYSKYQNKDASGSGQLTGNEIQSGSAEAKYRFTNWRACYCPHSKQIDWF